jgi:GABA permease
MRQVLVVANQTLAGRELRAELRSKMAEGPMVVRVVVPATAPVEDPWLIPAGPGGAPAPAAAGAQDGYGDRPGGYELAEQRLVRGLLLIGDLGLEVTGEVGDADPMRAVGDALAQQAADEVIISTLPHHVSHWLRADLPARVHRKHQVKVTTVTAHSGDG